MFAPAASGTTAITLKVTTEKVTAGKTVNVQLMQNTTNKGFEKGLKHTVTLSFGAVDKGITVESTSITAWGTGYSGNGTLEN